MASQGATCGAVHPQMEAAEHRRRVLPVARQHSFVPRGERASATRRVAHAQPPRVQRLQRMARPRRGELSQAPDAGMDVGAHLATQRFSSVRSVARYGRGSQGGRRDRAGALAGGHSQGGALHAGVDEEGRRHCVHPMALAHGCVQEAASRCLTLCLSHDTPVRDFIAQPMVACDCYPAQATVDCAPRTRAHAAANIGLGILRVERLDGRQATVHQEAFGC